MLAESARPGESVLVAGVGTWHAAIAVDRNAASELASLRAWSREIRLVRARSKRRDWRRQ